MLMYMFDTNIFNRILDGAIDICELRGRVHFYATHIQLDELKATSNVPRRQELLAVFKEVVEEAGECSPAPTAAATLVGRRGEARRASRSPARSAASFSAGESSLSAPRGSARSATTRGTAPGPHCKAWRDR